MTLPSNRQTWWLLFCNSQLPIPQQPPVAPGYGVYISQLIRYARACTLYIDFLDRDQHRRQRLLAQSYVVPRLKSSLQQYYGRHSKLVDAHELSITHIAMDLFPCSFLYISNAFIYSVYTPMLPKILKLVGFQIFWIWAYLMKVAPETRRAH